MIDYARELRELIRNAGIDAEIGIERFNHMDDLCQQIVDRILIPALGADAVGGQRQANGFDSERDASLEFFVKPDAVATAQALIPQIQEYLKPYAFENYPRNIHINAIAQ
jgi:hypothetical protein